MQKTLWLLLFLGTAFLCLSSAKAQVLSCSPAPCVTSNVQIGPSTTTYTTAGFSLASNYGGQTTAILGITANQWNSMSYCNSAGNSKSASYVTDNQGLSWSGGCQAASGSDTGPYQDPMSAYDVNGTLYSGQLGTPSVGSTNGIFLHTLSAGSNTWSNFFPTLSFTDAATDDFFLFDFPAIFIDNNQTNPRIYISAFEEGTDNNTGDLVTAAIVGVSSDGGSTWTTNRVSAIQTYPAEAVYTRVTSGSDSTVYVTWVQTTIGSTSETVYSSYSTNLGVSYSSPVSGFTMTNKAKVSCTTSLPLSRQVPNTCVRMFYYPNIAATKVGTTQTLFAVYPEYSGSQVSTELRYSTNKGATWSSGTLLAAKSGSDQFEPSIAADQVNAGTIGVAWLDTRNSLTGSPDTLFDAYGMTSSNGGSTWSALTRFSLSSGGISVTPVSGYAYLGDWIGSAFLNGYFFVAFPSTANGHHQVGMYAGFNP